MIISFSKEVKMGGGEKKNNKKKRQIVQSVTPRQLEWQTASVQRLQHIAFNNMQTD